MDYVEAAEVFKALSHESRLDMLSRLAETDKRLSMTELFDGIAGRPMSFGGRMFHLRLLREQGLVRTFMADGKSIALQLNASKIKEAIRFLCGSLQLDPADYWEEPE